MNTDTRGLLIALEGLDRSGKTTQCKLLHNYFLENSRKATVVRFPERANPTGKLIDSYLKGSVSINNEVIHLLFSANRWELKDKIIEELSNGTTVIMDRYAYSGVAFSSAKGLDMEWCKGCDRGLPMPDIVFHFKIKPEEIAKRGGFGGEVYEKKEFQEIVKEKYEMLKEENWLEVDGNQSVERVTEALIEQIEHFEKRNKENKIGKIGKLWV